MNSIYSFGLRMIKPLLLGLIMFFSLVHLGFSDEASLAGALVPVLLGGLNILVGLVYGLTGVVLMVAVASGLLKDAEVSLTKDQAADAVESLASTPAVSKSLEVVGALLSSASEAVARKLPPGAEVSGVDKPVPPLGPCDLPAQGGVQPNGHGAADLPGRLNGKEKCLK